MVNFPDLRRRSSGFSTVVAGPRLGEVLSPHDNSFGVMRLVLATLVLISHSYMYLAGSSATEPLFAETGRSLGQYAVQVFFILSGLMVAKSFHVAPSLRDFAAARALRIFPALIVCVLLTALILGPLLTSLDLVTYFTSRELGSYVVKTVSLATGSAPLPGLFETNPLAERVNTSLWTLKYEVICYAVLAGLGMLGGLLGINRQAWLGVGVVLLAIAIAIIFLNPPARLEDFTFIDNIRYFAVFFATGVLAYALRDRLILSGWIVWLLLAVFVASRGTAIAEVASAISLGYLALWAATKTFGPMRAFSNRMDLSYGVYIFAGPLQQALIHLIPAITPWVLTGLSLMIVLPIAMLSWVFVESPALRLRPIVGGCSAFRRRHQRPVAG